MKVWSASFWLAQQWLAYVFLAGVLAIAAEHRLDRLGLLVDLRRRLGFVPQHLDIETSLRWLGLALIAIWIFLSIAFTVATRLRIRRGNEVRRKR